MPHPILLLDVMDTLVHEPYFVEVPAFFDMTLEELRAQQHPTAWMEFEHGWIDEATYLRRFFRDGRPIDTAAFVTHLSDAFRWLPGVELLLSELRDAGLTMHAMSNYSCWYRRIEARLELSQFLSWSFVSCETGLRKPNPEVWTSAAQQLGTTPAGCLFVDDREQNVVAARDVGMPSILFEDAAALREQLVAYGILDQMS